MVRQAQITKKRRRPAVSCTECRRRKVKCDRNSPCSQCTVHELTSCTYAGSKNPPPNRSASQGIQGPVVREATDAGAVAWSRPFSNVTTLLNADGFDWTTQGTPPSTERPAVGIVQQSASPQNPKSGNGSGLCSPQSQAASGPIHGSRSKTRVFGRGHWVSALPLVCLFNTSAISFLCHC